MGKLKVREIKHFAEHPFTVKKEELMKLAKLQVELMEVCKSISEKDNLLDTQDYLNKLTGFKNAEMSAKAMGFEDEYERILYLDKKIAGRLTSESLTEGGRLKQSVIDVLREEYITYHTEGELHLKNEMDEITERFNNLPYNERVRFVMNTKKLLARRGW